MFRFILVVSSFVMVLNTGCGKNRSGFRATSTSSSQTLPTLPDANLPSAGPQLPPSNFLPQPAQRPLTIGELAGTWVTICGPYGSTNSARDTITFLSDNTYHEIWEVFSDDACSTPWVVSESNSDSQDLLYDLHQSHRHSRGWGAAAANGEGGAVRDRAVDFQDGVVSGAAMGLRHDPAAGVSNLHWYMICG